MVEILSGEDKVSGEKKKHYAWLSKYALTEGVVLVELKSPFKVGDYVSVSGRWAFVRCGSGLHETKDEAIANAEKMRAKKIASLEKSMAKLKGLVFE